MTASAIVTCSHCGAKNRVPENKSNAPAKCGRCHEPLSPTASAADPGPILTLRCSQCRTKNRVPAAKLNAGATCGRCHAPLPSQDVYTDRPVLVTDANFEHTVLNSPLPVLLYSWAPWCSVCSGTGPMVEQLAAETKGKVRVAKLNTETSPAVAQRYNILSVPTFFIFDGGQLKHQLPGAVPKHDLLMKMAQFL